MLDSRDGFDRDDVIGEIGIQTAGTVPRFGAKEQERAVSLSDPALSAASIDEVDAYRVLLCNGARDGHEHQRIIGVWHANTSLC